jgi:hypothetical protein
MSRYVYDIETYPNYFVAIFKDVDNGDVIKVRIEDRDTLKGLMDSGHTLIGFNNYNFDNIILQTLYHNPEMTCEDVKALADYIINEVKGNGLTIWQLHNAHQNPGFKSIDLLGLYSDDSSVEGAKSRGLKSHEVRLGMDRVLECPIHFSEYLDDAGIVVVDDYCMNDIETTEKLFWDVQAELTSREGINQVFPGFDPVKVFNKSRSAIAESLMGYLYREATGNKLTTRLTEKSDYVFDFENDILANIEFVNPANQIVLEGLKANKLMGCDEIYRRYGGKKEDGCLSQPLASFMIGGSRYSVRLGGIHSSFPAFYKESNFISDYDVASYYPELLTIFNETPAGRDKAWINILNDIKQKRLVAKKAGDKSAAEVYKIIINSTYGKLGSDKSGSYDQRLLYKVTINGQLSLLMICEHLVEKYGVEIISLNTDGFTINCSDEDHSETVRHVMKYFASHLKMEFEETRYCKYLSLNVNNYAALKLDGSYKCKGSFLNLKKTYPGIVHDAVMHKFLNGKDVDETITSCRDHLKFCYSAKILKADEVIQGDRQLQKVLRYYVATDGQPIFKVTNGKRSSVDNAEKAQLLLNVADARDNIDYGYYVDAAEKIINQVQDGVNLSNSDDDITDRLELAAKLQKLGLIIQPKGSLAKPKQNVPRTFDSDTLVRPIESWDWNYWRGLGIVLTEETNLITIDIDYPELVKYSGLLEVLPKNLKALVSMHGKSSKAGILKGECRGSLTFKYSGNLKNTAGDFLKKYGFEIIRVGRVIQVDGFHTSGSKYKFTGRPENLPKNVEEYLNTSVIGYQQSNKSDYVTTVDGALYKLEQFQKLSDIDLTLTNVLNETPFLTGVCPGHHTDGGTDMRIYATDNSFSSHCFHSNCDEHKEFRRNVARKVAGLKTIDALRVKPSNPSKPIHYQESGQPLIVVSGELEPIRLRSFNNITSRAHGEAFWNNNILGNYNGK